MSIFVNLFAFPILIWVSSLYISWVILSFYGIDLLEL